MQYRFVVFGILAVLMLASVYAQEPAKAVYRINAGGAPFTDIYGNNWRSDAGYFAAGYKQTSDAQIRKTDIDQLYQSCRAVSFGDLKYRFPLPNGKYQVILHFSETSSSDPALKQRWFDVIAENKTVLWSVSIYNEVQTRGALIKIFDIGVSDESLDLIFARRVGEPKVCGIEIISQGGQPALGVSDTEISFNETNVGNTSRPKQIVLRNLGGRTMNLYNISVEGEFIMTARPPYLIPPDSGITFEVSYAPTSEGKIDGILKITSDDPNSPHTIKLSAAGENSFNRKISNGLIAKIYSIDKNVRLLPSFENLNPKWMAVAANVNFPVLKTGFFDAPFKDNFAMLLQGLLSIEEVGNYTFYLTSDDGSRLIIDGKEIVVNDKTHRMKIKTGNINLTKGFHNISVEYFERTDKAGLVLEWKTPSAERTLIPANAYFYDLDAISPFINEVKDFQGPKNGGNTITIYGLGFSSENQVLFGNNSPQEQRIINSSIIQVVAPSGNDTIRIKVITSKGESNGATYSYNDAKTRFHLRLATSGPVNDIYRNKWNSDIVMVSGQRYLLRTEIASTPNDALYQTFRQTNETPLKIKINVPKGEYEINLHFAELSANNSHIGKRVFNVIAQGNYIGTVDIFKEAGTKKALVKTFVTRVDNGTLDIVLTPRNGKPEVSAIEVIGK